MPKCTLKDIARAAGVSVSAVSFALRNHPNVSRATAVRVQEVARRLDYRPDPRIAALMHTVRTGRARRMLERLAFVWVDATRADNARNAYQQQIIAGTRARAATLGFACEEYWLSEDGVTERRLGQILRARGITGVIFSPCAQRQVITLDLPWHHLAVAVIGNAVWRPAIDRAAHDHYRGVVTALERLTQAGYRRIGGLFNVSLNARADRVMEAAFFSHHPLPREARKLIGFYDAPAPFNFMPLLNAMAKTKPEALLISDWQVGEKLNLSASYPAVAALDCNPEISSYAGIAQHNSEIAAKAVDLVAGRLLRNERGLPSIPVKVSIDGEWRDGASVQSRPVEAEG